MTSQNTSPVPPRALILILREILRHEDFVIVATALLERLLLESVLHEPETGIEPQRGFIAGDHGQLDELDVPARGIDDRFDQPASDADPPCLRSDIHADERSLVGHLGTLSDD